MAAYDKVYRRLFADFRLAHDLITGFVLPPGRWRVELQEVTGANHVTDSGQVRVSDLIWKARVRWFSDLGLAQDALLCFLLEFQSRPDLYMALRASVYTGLLLQGLQGNPQFREGGLPDTLSVQWQAGVGRAHRVGRALETCDTRIT